MSQNQFDTSVKTKMILNRQKIAARLDAIARGVIGKGEVRVQPYVRKNSADLRRATQRALRLEKQAQTTGKADDWIEAARAWRDAEDNERALNCKRMAR